MNTEKSKERQYEGKMKEKGQVLFVFLLKVAPQIVDRSDKYFWIISYFLITDDYWTLNSCYLKITWIILHTSTIYLNKMSLFEESLAFGELT